MFDDVETTFEPLANIKVIGVGGGGKRRRIYCSELR